MMVCEDVQPHADPTLPLDGSQWQGGVLAQFSRWVEQTPDHPAVEGPDGTWSYRQLDTLSSHIAHTLLAHNIQAQDVVAVLSERVPALVPALLGILKAGAAFLVLDAAYPAARLADCLRLARPAGWITTTTSEKEELADTLAPLVEGHRVRLAPPPAPVPETFRAATPVSNPPLALPDPHPDATAYIAFTSGTSGSPRGIIGTHRPLDHFFHWYSKTFDFSPSDRFSMLSGLSHDPLLRDIFAPLWLGATLCVPTPEMLDYPERLVSWMQSITVSHLTPSMGHLLVQGARGHTHLPALRYLFAGGDVLTLRTAQQWQELAPAATVVNFYGTTETPQAMSYAIVPSDTSLLSAQRPERNRAKTPHEKREPLVPLGHGIADTQLLVLTSSRQLADVGEVGEIAIRTPYLSRGYVDDHGLTRERFIVNPLTGHEQDRLYLTGDRGFYLPDGAVVFGGRADNQVKIRGFRIELRDVDAALLRHPSVLQAVVVARSLSVTRSVGDGTDRGTPDGEETSLVAYVVAGAGDTPSPADLRDFLATRLPAAMIPSVFVLLERLPLTPNGKIDEAALPDPHTARDERGQPAYVAPRTPLEETIAAIWGEVLHLNRVGIQDDFFAYGGHSLLAAQVVARLRDTLMVEVSLPHVLEYPTPAGLAAQVQTILDQQEQQEQQTTGAWGAIPRRADPTAPVPLSFAQQRIWFFHQFAPNHALYHIPLVLHLVGPLNVAPLRQTLLYLVQRHESLRTRFRVREGQPEQHIINVSSIPDVPLNRVDLNDVADTERETVLHQRITDEIHRSFDLTTELPFRATLFRLGAQEHVILFVLHHIVADEWSLGVLRHEFSLLYAACAAGRPPTLPPLPLQYSDVALWQQAHLGEPGSNGSNEGKTGADQLRYWLEKLDGMPPALELPISRPRPPLPSYQGARQFLSLSPQLTIALKTHSRQQSATLFMMLLAAFQVLLVRYTGQDDCIVGTPVANRPRTELEGVIGCFINMLVLRNDLSGDPSFAEVLQRVRTTTLDGYRHQEVPFEHIVAELQPERDLSRHPLVQVVFALQTTPTPPATDITGLRQTPLDIHPSTVRFDLEVQLWDTGEQLEGFIDYSTDLFEESSIALLARHFTTLLEGVASDLTQPIARLPLVSAEERHIIMHEWNATVADYPHDACLHQLFEQQAAATPHATAVIAGQHSIRYGELNQRANQLAHYLHHLGVEPGTTVGVCVGRSLDLVIGLLGILKAGGTYVPLDPTYPTERLAYMLDHSQAPVLLTQTERLERCPTGGKGRVVCLDAEGEAIARMDTQNPISRATPDTLAYIIYTSGSTGKPKGVMIPHRGAVNTIYDVNSRFRVSPQDCVLALSSFSFDLSVYDCFGTLAAGATLVLPDPDTAGDPAHWAHLVAQHRVSIWNSVPTLMKLLLDYAESHPNVSLASLRLALLSGDWIPLPLPERLKQMVNGIQVISLGGATEGSIWSILYPIERTDPTWSSIPYGRPMANQQFFVFNEALEPCPVLVPGDLYIGGVGVARGYWRDPQKTAASFIAHPQTGEWLYRTGDMGRYLPDGMIEFLGRRDQQVKIRGFRIELGEIEATLLQHPAVRDAVLLARDDSPSTPGDRRLVAYIVPVGVEPPAPDDLRQFLAARLPDYMLPAAFVFLDALPHTPNGKIDRKALPAPDTGRPDTGTGYTPPRSPLEQMLTSIWGKRLNLERVGIHDNFFALGGHSLLAIQLVDRIERETGQAISLISFFQHPTVAGLSQLLEQPQERAGPDRGEAALVPIPPAPEQEKQSDQFSLSHGQQALWFIYQSAPHSAAYNSGFALRFRGPLERDRLSALRRALHALAVRHPSLRSRVSSDGPTAGNEERNPLQVVQEPQEATLPALPEIIDATGWSEQELRRQVQAFHQQPFDLEKGPVWRAGLFSRSPDEHILMISLHHLFTDARSNEILSRDLALLYTAEQGVEMAPLTPLAHNYRDYVRWETLLLQVDGERLRRYWHARLGGEIPLLALPTDKPRPPIQTFNGAACPIAFDEALTSQLRELARANNTTLFVLLLAAYQVLLARYTGQDDILVGTAPEAGRSRPEFADVVGYFVNPVVLRAIFSADDPPTFAAFLDQARQTVLEMLSHQHYPFPLLVRELQPQRDASYSPLFQTLFLLYHSQQPVQDDGETQSPERFSFDEAAGAGQFDLSLLITDRGETLRGVFDYNADLFEPATIARMATHFKTLIRAIVANPEQRIDRLPLLSEAERNRLLVQWNETAAEYPHTRCLPDLFETQVGRTPDAVAVSFAGQQHTYRELNEQANQLAHALRRLGVGTEVLVGICVERSPDMVVGLLGVLKAGGGYVPLDPAFPAERLAFMLEDAGVGVLLVGGTGAAVMERVLIGRATAVQHIISLDDWEGIAGNPPGTPASSPDGAMSPDTLAYVIYTSGSTGKPKGVQITHRALVNFLHAMQHRPGLTADDVLLAVTTLSFDIAMLELFLPLIVGARVELLSRDVANDGAQLIQALERSGATVLQATPMSWRMLIEAGWRGSPHLTMLCGGEALPWELARQMLSRGKTLWNMYGPTETTIWSAVLPVSPDDGEARIGPPIANTQFFVLDRHYQPVPIGVAGELYIGGDGLARGYRNRLNLTSERFIANPFGAGRLYRTGDLVRYRPDGTLTFLGRVDHQVKVRGFRIEPGEIEAVLNQHPDVQQVVVVARDDGSGTQLVAYLVARVPIEPHTLRTYAAERLPDYMLPAAFVQLDTLPQTPNGKVDRNALPAPEGENLARAAFVAPRTRTEKHLAACWQTVLGLERVGVHDNFFALGGHSLLALHLMACIEERSGQSIPLSALFQHPTIADLSHLLEQQPEHHHQQEQREQEEPRSLVAIQPDGSKYPLFFVHPIGGNVLCYHELARQLGPDQPVYGLQAVGLSGEFPPLGSIEEMAGRYLSELRAVQPQGPYHLGGWSLGGTIALEMAQQLRAQGEQVEVLVLIDTFASLSEGQAGDEPGEETREISLMKQFLADLRGETRHNLPPLAIDEVPPLVPPDHLDTEARLTTLLERARAADLLHPTVTLEQARTLWRVFRANMLAASRYTPAPYSGRVVLCYATEQPTLAADEWDERTLPHLKRHPLPATHDTILQQPHVALLAAYLARL